MFFATLLFQPQIENEPTTISMYIFIWGPSSDLAFVSVRQNCNEVKILYWSLRFDPCSSGNYPLLASSFLVYLFSCAIPKYLKIINSLGLLCFAFKNPNILWSRNIPSTSFMWEHRNTREKEKLSQIPSELLQIPSEAKQSQVNPQNVKTILQL